MIFAGKELTSFEKESVLDCLLRHHVSIDYSCKNGICQSCLLKSLGGVLESIAQRGLRPTAIKQDFFLACQQKCESIDEASFIDADLLFSHARLVDKQFFSDDICRLLLEPVGSIYYHAGQFINLKNPDGIIRSYSIASIPSQDASLELHIHKKVNGVMSHWIFDEFNVGDNIDYQGPIGQCFYVCSNTDTPLILIGTGTGAAPLIGILRDALSSGHKGSIVFFHGARKFEGLYLHERLLVLENNYSNFCYRPCLSEETTLKIDDNSTKIDIGRCNDIALTEMATKEMNPTKDTLLFLCGNPKMVKTTRQKAFLAGVASKNIYIDPFEYKDLRKTSR